MELPSTVSGICPLTCGDGHRDRGKPTLRATAAAAAKLSHAAMRRRDHLPGDLAPELIDACLDASRRIRLERHVAYDRPVVLERDGGELTLLPIAGTETRLFVPFHFARGAKTVERKLVLEGRDPLPLLIGEGVVEEDAITAWTYALLGFANATCIELEPVKLTGRREPKRPRHPSASISRRPFSAQTLPRKPQRPNHLEPVGRWIRSGGSYVPGFRRHLPDGWTASDEARDRARQVGIILHWDETWVRGHIRGVPEGVEIRFRWHAPTELQLLRVRPQPR